MIADQAERCVASDSAFTGRPEISEPCDEIEKESPAKNPPTMKKQRHSGM
jgi:hypothetical protein